MEYHCISAETLKSYLHDGREIALLDARDEVLHDHAHLFMASCVPLSRLECLVTTLVPQRHTRVVWCDDGEGFANSAAEKMLSLGYQDVSILSGGVSAWRDAGYAVYNGVHVPSKAFAEVIEHEVGTPWISVDQLYQMMKTDEDFVLVDTRTVEEFVDNGLPGAVSAPGAELVMRFPDLVPSPNSTVVVHCGGRTRSIIGAQALIDAGYSNKIVSLRNGTQGWMLAGYDIVRGSQLFAPNLSEKGLQTAQAAAERIQDQFDIEKLSNLEQIAELVGFDVSSTGAEKRTSYLIDVRSQKEFEAGHIPAAKHVHGGQLIQETERHLAVWGAQVILVDDNGVRATITAAWLKQMGWDVKIATLSEWDKPLDSGPSVLKRPDSSGEDSVQWISPDELKSQIDADTANVIDIDWSADYLAGHIPGAWWTLRRRLATDCHKLPVRSLTVLTSSDDHLAELAAKDNTLSASGKIAVLRGGTKAWVEHGYQLSQGKDRMLSNADDIRLKARQEEGDRKAAMRNYLNWELGLVEQLSHDDDPRYDINRYRVKST